MSALHPDQLLQPGYRYVEKTKLTILLKAVDIYMTEQCVSS